ncbi:MAG: DinB family protein [Anaerolineales bacterium]|nr:DinB family protein [Anaerolineales bacterium]
MEREFLPQYAHTWRVFERLVNDFDDDAWLHAGRRAVRPARLAFHILHAAKYYLEDVSDLHFASGKPFEVNCETVKEENLPSRADVIDCIRRFHRKTESWLSGTDFSAQNTAFPWAGATKLGVVVFLMRHSLYHLGELSSLLNESRNGDVQDHYVKALEET